MKRLVTIVSLIIVAVGVIVGVAIYRERAPKSTLQTSTGTTSEQPPSTEPVIWLLKENNTWKVTQGIAPPCPDPFLFTMPVDITKLSGILFPGQPRPEFKNHGAFRFRPEYVHDSTVSVPYDATVVRASHDTQPGENQYAVEFIVPCGFSYHFGHLRVLSPKFKDIIDHLPPPDENSSFSTLTQPIEVKTGEIIATEVGYSKDDNIFVDWGVMDLRHKNGASLRPEWSQYADAFDEYSVCWLNYLPEKDREQLRSLHNGTVESGTKSDYCRFPENL